jgi:hypothetical protein
MTYQIIYRCPSCGGDKCSDCQQKGYIKLPSPPRGGSAVGCLVLTYLAAIVIALAVFWWVAG